MKRILLIVLSVIMVLLLSSCGRETEDNKTLPTLPTIHINNIDGLHIDRNIWRDTYISVTNAGDDKNKIPTQAQMRGRGNSTWDLAYRHNRKYPMRFRFPADNPQGILGLAPARDFVLLANAHDTTNARNYFAYKIARSIATDNAFNPSAVMVGVYLNGYFQGLYLLTEQMQAHENRVNIDMNDTLQTEWFLEMDPRVRYTDDTWFWAYMAPGYRRSFEVRDPSNPSDDQIDYVRNILENFYRAIHHDIDNVNLEDYININSFINFFIVQELFLDYDIDLTSSFIVVDRYGIIHMGPTWDYDHSMVNYLTARWSHDSHETAYERFRNDIHSNRHIWMNQLLRNETFVEAFIARWEYLQDTINEILSEASMNSFIDKVEESALLPSERKLDNPGVFWCLRTNSRQESEFKDNVENFFYGVRFRQTFVNQRFPLLLNYLQN